MFLRTSVLHMVLAVDASHEPDDEFSHLSAAHPTNERIMEILQKVHDEVEKTRL